MLIQFHILQNYAPSNLNRDDTGAPKDAVFGGVRRGRISSQCIKRSIRRSTAFAEVFGKDNLLGVRTRKLPSLIKDELLKLGVEEPDLSAIVDKLSGVGRESGKKNPDEEEATEVEAEASEKEDMVKQLMFLGRNEIGPMAGALLEIYKKMGQKEWAKTDISKITKGLKASLPRSVDIAMFGRMTTSDAFEDVSAAVQVAHAISTNTLNQEFDYFTAVDDLADEPGAGMIGDIEFNSSTYYKYVNVHWEELVNNLGGDVEVAAQGVIALLDAVVKAQPTGKQNTFAAFNLPNLILVEVSETNLPVSYTNAFLKPVKATHDATLMQNSITSLCEYIQKISTAFNLTPKRACLNLEGEDFPTSERVLSLDELKNWLKALLPREI
ncbi:MAG TPA: type I-E CRISPR-associated protein Cas7/Cse4/CasC [Anaerolineaceae bacterium]|nr:type I-E CRISPR-associated protein Cas7/Cse4/CasC [Anaerolineaceae bacterium]